MQMQQIRYFIALCEEQNFTRAAHRCGVAQPSLTRAIKLLENELGGVLFVRAKKRTKLSQLGSAVQPHLRQTLQAATAATEAAEKTLAVWPTSQPGSDGHVHDPTRAFVVKRNGRPTDVKWLEGAKS